MTPLVESSWVADYRDLVGPQGRADPAAAPGRRGAVRPGPDQGRSRACSSRGRRPNPWSAGRSMPSRRIRNPVVIDLCTGSGAIALAIAPGQAGRQGARGGTLAGRAGLGQAQHRGARRRGRRARSSCAAGTLPTNACCSTWTRRPIWSPSTRRTCRDGTPVEPEVGRHDPPEAVFAGAGWAGGDPAVDLRRRRPAEGRGSAGHRARRHPGRVRARPAGGPPGARRRAGPRRPDRPARGSSPPGGCGCRPMCSAG